MKELLHMKKVNYDRFKGGNAQSLGRAHDAVQEENRSR